MSWGAYITNSLVNKQDANNHVYNNVLTEAALMGYNGAEWAKTSGLTVSKAEVDKLNELFKQSQTAYHQLTLEEKNIKSLTMMEMLPI